MSTYIDPNTEAWIEQLQSRIAELEGKLMQCPRCGDPITNELGDNPICGACALASELNVKTLQERVAELEAENAIFRNADYESLQCGSRIAELQAENTKLKEALESSARKLKELGSEYENCPPQHDCPSDLGLGCQQCWLDWLMGHE